MEVRAHWWALVVAVLALAASAPPASAAFPAADGQLALAPLSGSGVLIASPQTGRARRVCDGPQTCSGPAADARFSPNGREIVVRTNGGALQTTTVTGACVWCATSLPHVTIRGSSPAFTPDGQTITYVHDGLWEVTPGRPNPTRLRLLYGPVSAVAWSPSGKVVAVRRGWLWTGVRQGNAVVLATRLTRGAAPAWSPDGRELAFTRKGVVFTIRLSGHRIARIGRGSAPAFSPNGAALAYLNPRHQVTIRTAGHGRTRTRTLTRLRGRSLDWQPVTTVTRRGCSIGIGVPVARSPAATIRQAADPQGGNIGWNGCLTTLGIPFHLNNGQDGYGYNLSLEHVALAGDYAAMQFNYNDKYQDFTNTVEVYDLRSGALVHSETVPCQDLPCGVSSLAVNADGFAAWHSVETPTAAAGTISPISCPTAELCVAGGLEGDLFVSTAPSEGRSAWTRVSLGSGTNPIVGISCPDATLCVAVAENGTVYSSADPTGGAATWHAAPLGTAALQDVSCPSDSLCVAVGGAQTYITTDPTGPGSGWTAHPVSSASVALYTVSCPTSSLCVVGGGGDGGDVFSSSDPADTSPSWTATQVPGLNFIRTIDCPTATFCAAGGEPNSGAALLTSTDPAGGAGAWTEETVSGFITSVTCAGTSLCLAVNTGGVLTSLNPSAASPTWSETTLSNAFTDASCPSTTLCLVAAGPAVLTATNPSGGPSAWTSTPVDALPCYPCLAETLTAVDDHGTHTLDTAPPGPGTHVADLGFTGNTLSWTHDGAPRSAALS